MRINLFINSFSSANYESVLINFQIFVNVRWKFHLNFENYNKINKNIISKKYHQKKRFIFYFLKKK